jgi:hypothetical protein
MVSQICGIPTFRLGSGNGEQHSAELQHLQGEGADGELNLWNSTVQVGKWEW